MAIPTSLGPCLKYYSIISEVKHLRVFFLSIIQRYIQEARAPRICELCQRSCLALTAHHLIPRSVHGKALQERWREKIKKDLGSIAWLCRGCHEHVHRTATPEALGRQYWTTELLLQRTEIWLFAKAIGRLVNSTEGKGQIEWSG